MDKRQNSWTKRLRPSRLADEANDEFVRLAQLLARLLTWDVPLGQGQGAGGADSGAASVTVERRDARGSPCRRRSGYALDSDHWEALAQRLDRMAGQTAAMPARGSPQRTTGAGSAMQERTRRLKLRELFDRDEACRLGAVQRIRQGGFCETVPLLESVLVIETSPEVREAIDAALVELKSGRGVNPNPSREE